ncbi:RNA polymerase sporulation sigma factor SigH [Candidatus Galacturonibacter soehngenii]|uniref:RNA polymerase sigma factor SigS n=1 Tax=Candidatus Galacturonatibacter soehngenii TaxID=2307010 RepID=A0A7V7QNB6_9FIRM|nr:RNA polymerase sporulation sigma factor SigH [Candidatus Galacturonibacter soehngenii]KAB1440499.1 RNA polymerase sporulation sigma factor SigH [Candidatus Galacturonibacter soehngenii]
MDKYTKMSDEELISLAQNGNNQVVDYLMEKYKNFVRKKAYELFMIGGDNDDLIQEGMIGLFKAVRDYNRQKDTSFFTFADLCISRQMYTAIHASKRKKHIPLNTYISLYAGISEEENDEHTLMNRVYSIHDKNPEELFIDKENEGYIEEQMQENLSTFEMQVINLYLTGMSYVRIAEILERTPKSVDNAIQRIRSKLSFILSEKS